MFLTGCPRSKFYEPKATVSKSMAKKPYTRRKRRFTLRRVRVSSELALSTLGSDTAITNSLTGISAGAYRMMSLKLAWTLSGKTIGEGPLTVGYAHSDYSVTEVKECLEAFAAIDQGDKQAQEQADRLIRTVGTFGNQGGDQAMVALNAGMPVLTRLNWLINIGDSVNFFVFNEATAALTTGAVVNAQGDVYIKDSS